MASAAPRLFVAYDYPLKDILTPGLKSSMLDRVIAELFDGLLRLRDDLARLPDYAAGIKLHTSFEAIAHSRRGLERLQELCTSHAVIIDRKIYDIPETTENLVAWFTEVFWPWGITVAAPAGSKSMEAAIRQVKSRAASTKILAVGQLTSVDYYEGLKIFGMSTDGKSTQAHQLWCAHKAGARHMIASPADLDQIANTDWGSEVYFLTPGSRPAGQLPAGDDQVRVGTPRHAIETAGLDASGKPRASIIIGRPVMQFREYGFASRFEALTWAMDETERGLETLAAQKSQ